LIESPKRKTLPAGSYQGYAQLWNSGAKAADDRPCKTAHFCTYQSLHFAFVATHSETTATGLEPDRGESVSMDILRSDFEMGLLWRQDWHWGRSDSDISYALGFMGGVCLFGRGLLKAMGLQGQLLRTSPRVASS
jgi:hypothetical protein